MYFFYKKVVIHIDLDFSIVLFLVISSFVAIFYFFVGDLDEQSIFNPIKITNHIMVFSMVIILFSVIHANLVFSGFVIVLLT